MGAGGDGGAGAFYDAALHKRQALMGKSGPMALVKNFRVFRVAAFACIGGVLYGYNQGMFSGVLAMPAFGKREFLPITPALHPWAPPFFPVFLLTELQPDMGEYTTDQTKKGWLTAILELGAWVGTLLSGFLAEVLSRKYGVLVASAVFMLGVVVQATAVTVGPNAILAGRFVTWVLPELFARAVWLAVPGGWALTWR